MDYFHLSMDRQQLLAVSNLGLAHLGDGVYELMVRSYLCLHGKSTNKGLHKAAQSYVSAPAQARLAPILWEALTDEEREIYRRGRNASPHSIPAHASREDYQAATALETVFGYLYLRGETDRLNQLFERLMEG